MHPHTKFGNSYLKVYRKYAPDTIILKTESKVKVTVTKKGMWNSAIPKIVSEYDKEIP